MGQTALHAEPARHGGAARPPEAEQHRRHRHPGAEHHRQGGQHAEHGQSADRPECREPGPGCEEGQRPGDEPPRSRPRVSRSSSPRTAASGVRRAASSAGAAAATRASGRPTANASPTIRGSSGGTVAEETIQNWLTVEEVSRTAPCASSQPSGAPSAQPSIARAPASPRNSVTTARRVTPSVRSRPISCRRVMTDTATVL